VAMEQKYNENVFPVHTIHAAWTLAAAC
jgi:hypothetical protein